jgi:hypothetical protein
MSNDLKDLNFKVDAIFHKNYKLVATLKGLTMRELLEKTFYDYVRATNDRQLKKLVRPD